MRHLITSLKDIASLTIRDTLIEEYNFEDTGQTFEGSPIYSNGKTELITTENDLIFTGHLEEHFESEVFIYCSRHRSQSGRPALLVHSTGNFGADNSYGGNPRQLSVSVGSLVGVALQELHRQREERDLKDYDVTMEVTHHGPTSMNTPLLFVELGSDESHWKDREGAACVAAAVMKCLSAPIKKEALIGFGGNHYASKFNRVVLEESGLIGHIAPKHALDSIAMDTVSQMINRARERVRLALIDWKGTNADQKARLFPILDELGIEYLKVKKYLNQ